MVLAGHLQELGAGGSRDLQFSWSRVTSSSPPSRRKKARTGGEGDSYDPYDFSDAEEEMPEGESPGFCRLLRVLLPSALVGLCTWGAVMPWGHLGSLVWYHRAPQIKMNFFFETLCGHDFLIFFFFSILFQNCCRNNNAGREGVWRCPPHPRAKCFCSLGAWTPGRLKVTLLSPPVQAHTPKVPEASAADEAKKPALAEPR